MPVVRVSGQRTEHTRGWRLRLTIGPAIQHQPNAPASRQGRMLVLAAAESITSTSTAALSTSTNRQLVLAVDGDEGPNG